MASPDDYSATQREDDQRIAAASRLADVARRVAAEDRAQFWDQLGFNTRNDSGLDRLRRVLNAVEALGIDTQDGEGLRRSKRAFEWLYEAYESSLTRNKRLLTWLTTVVGIGTGALAFIKFYIDWRHP